MGKKILIIGGVIFVVGTIAAIIGNKSANNTNIGDRNEAQIYQCSDGIDNDQDKLIDEKDSGCHSDGNVDNPDSYNQKDDNEDDELMQGGNLRDFFSGKMRTDLMCEATYKIAEDNEIKTVMYISGERIRLDYDMKNPIPRMGGKIQKNFYIVSDGEYGYVWGDSTLGEMMQGFKIKMDDMDSEQEAPTGTEMIDYEMPVTNCKPWIVDEKMFEIPEGIEFINPDDLEDMTIEDIVPSESIGIECSLCHQLPEDQVADCLSSLGCE
ncbi:MAG: hypothetical protein KAI67_03695 [Candidatus Pacebacteria bacterium]|nr:hypothetical protein [Candidatus Paceibacterota bacterium]